MSSGRYSYGFAWISRRYVELAAGDRSAAWQAGFAEMIAFAGKKGWLSSDGELIRAHIEWR